MRKSLFLAVIIIMTSFTTHAQQDITGEYYLEGVMETASAFKFNADSTFEFYFSYGALDRSGEGRWIIRDGNLVLNSRTRPPKDFALINSKSVPGKDITIQITEKNTMLLSYVACTLRSETDSITAVTDSRGIVLFKKQAVQTIALLFQLCPDRPSSFSIADTSHNYFEFRFEPWIAEVFFSNFILKPVGNTLQGKHPLLEDKTYSYVKQEK